MLDRAGKTVHQHVFYNGTCTNNVAEYEAVIAALKEALNRGCKEVVVHSDSMLIINQIAGRYKVRDAKLKGLNAKARALLAGFEKHDLLNVPRTNKGIVAVDRDLNLFLDGRAKKRIGIKKGNHKQNYKEIIMATQAKPSGVPPQAKEIYDEAGKLFEDNKFDEAIALYTKAIDEYSDYASAYFNRALSYALLSKYDEAKKDAKKVLELEPDKADAPYVMGDHKRVQAGQRRARSRVVREVAEERP